MLDQNRSLIATDVEALIEIITQQGDFDFDWYQLQSDVYRFELPIENPIRHFLLENENMDFDPEPGFDSNYYFYNNLDVRDSGLNPYIHYLLFGKHQGRKPFAAWKANVNNLRWKAYDLSRLEIDKKLIKQQGAFNEVFYRHLCDIYDLEIQGDPIEHYLLIGASKGMDPEQDFDTRFYLSNNRDVWLSGTNPYVHYLRDGKAAGRKPYRFKFVCREMQHLVINSDGDVSGCSIDVRMLNTFSNIYKESYSEARKKFMRMRADLFRNPHKYPACKECLHHCQWSEDSRGGLRLVGYCTTNPEPSSANYYIARTKIASTQFHIELSSTCNASCSTCFRFDDRFYRERSDMDIEKLKDAFGSDIKEATFVQMFYYGEPFVNKRTGEFLEYVADNAPNARVMFSTNGVYFNEKHAQAVVNAAQKIPITIMVSLHGSNQENTRKYMGETFQFNKAFNNLCYLKSIKLEACDIEIIWKYVLFSWNDSDEAIAEVKQRAEIAGVQKIHFILTKQPSPSKRFLVGSQAWQDFGKDMVYSQAQVFEYQVPKKSVVLKSV